MPPVSDTQGSSDPISADDPLARPPDLVEEPAELDTTAPADSVGSRRRRWPLVSAAVGVVVVLAIVVAGFSTSWFGRSGSDSSSRLVKSDSKALAAAVIADLPYGVSVSWSSGSGKLGRAAGPGSDLQGGLNAFLLLKWDNHQYILSVDNATTPPGNSITSNGSIKFGYDNEGRPSSLSGMHWWHDHMVEVTELAGPGGAGDLPLQRSDVQRLLQDNLLSVQTTQDMFDKSRDLANYRTKMPVVKWLMNPP